MTEVKPFQTNTTAYSYWLSNPTFDFYIDLNLKINFQDTIVSETSGYILLISEYIYLNAKKYDGLKTALVKSPHNITFKYMYHKVDALAIEITPEQVSITSDQTSAFPVWGVFSQGKLALSQTYGDLLRLCKKKHINLTKKYQTDKELEKLILDNELIYKEVFRLQPSFFTLVTKEKTEQRKLLLDLENKFQRTKLEDALDFIETGFSEIYNFFPSETAKLGVALSGGKDSAIITSLARSYFPTAEMQSYSQISDIQTQLAIVQDISEKLEIRNNTLELACGGLEIVDPWDPYLNQYNKANFDLAELISKETNIYFNGFGGDELLKHKTIEQDTLENTKRIEIDFINKSYVYESIIASHQATSPFYLRHGVIPFSPFCMPNYYFGLLLIDEKLKYENNIYKAVLNRLGLPNLYDQTIKIPALNLFFATELGKTNKKFADISTISDYKSKKQELLLTHRKRLHNLSSYCYNSEYVKD